MITKRQRNKIKKVLGENYTDNVEQELHKMGARNRNGMPHSKANIRNVMNGREHSEIERAIYNAVETRNREIKEESKRRKQILEQTKTGAATPV